ncbi:hypothetical protein DYB32_001412 [Aphanomyces invadans]|uniref:folate gamma-glutamyl hydrolase n=1 Tax=Aphanomyces invadans TaxID=157072 RepID=A0A3R6YEX0_9STRA|nr:hypothetical protein DYB32_001412 [Aphanomyces invadans]
MAGVVVGGLAAVAVLSSTMRSTDVAGAATSTPARPVVTSNPIIGIHAHESLFHDEFIASSYVKWIESAGGRAVRIPYNTSTDKLARLLSSVNGVLFPGGYGDPPESAWFMYNYAIEVNSNGTYFPLWGTCLGLEWLVKLSSQDHSILDHVDARNVTSNLTFLDNALETSRMFGFSPSFRALETAALSYNYHQWAITLDHFMATPVLRAFFRPLATSVDRQGVVYVAAIEARTMPIYGIQFHPEKNPYEFGHNKLGAHYAIDHSYDAILASQAFAHFFIREAQQNNHTFESPSEEQAALLYNQHTTNRSYPSYEEILVFASDDGH